ncbi:conserved oligomeric Golgi complex subunit 3 [Cimex lectularius]|uniref:Conserved oligomeric Golgi complex subunit 3 n=1 Tax=Cimex lectularius TaxID=79782 RepID=A0A8I6R907_CIMLE|nr:conserved oligomeric Golgi complex subunit 3 [Cimex lectularius]
MDLVNNMIADWENTVRPLAPLSVQQKDLILDMTQEIKQVGLLTHNKQAKVEEDMECKNSIRKEKTDPHMVNNIREFIKWYMKKEDEWYEKEDDNFKEYVQYLLEEKGECSLLLSQVDECLDHLKQLGVEYELVSNKTNSLHQVSEELISDQMKLTEVRDVVKARLNHFKSLERIVKYLDNTMLIIQNHSSLRSILDEINDHIQYHKSHMTYKESYSYLSRYEQCLRRLLGLIRDSIISGLKLAAQHASASSASHYAKFQVAKTNLRPLIALLEERVSHSNLYETTLSQCHEAYVSERQELISPSVLKTIDELVASNTMKGGVVDLCSLMRSVCAFLIHVSLDEYQLYQQFFSKQTDIFTTYLESLCVCLYDKTRPLVIHMKHLESLAELCSILHLEMIQEQVNANEEALKAFGNIAEQLLQDVQERLVFRAHMYLRTDVAEYKPSPGDLAYPEKLHMMQSIANSLHEQELSLSRSESKSSLTSGSSSTSQETRLNNPLSTLSGSPADLHGMWYPPVRRTLLCLSRLYRCVEKPTFQGISQEALSLCMKSIKDASQQISLNKSHLDGEMFQIKHLLILREQIAPFQVDFTVKEMALDFSKTKTAAAQLINKRTRLFSLSSNNSLLEFLLEGSPEVREQWLDSRKDVDRGLKSSCESFILHATHHLMPNFISVLEKAENWDNKEVLLKNTKWASPQVLSMLIQSTIKNIKSKLPGLQSTMQLYLANRDTEFILYRPIKNNVLGNFARMQHLLSTCGYTKEEQSQIGCPTSEQAYILVSSASLLGQQQQARKISNDNVDGGVHK